MTTLFLCPDFDDGWRAKPAPRSSSQRRRRRQTWLEPPRQHPLTRALRAGQRRGMGRTRRTVRTERKGIPATVRCRKEPPAKHRFPKASIAASNSSANQPAACRNPATENSSPSMASSSWKASTTSSTSTCVSSGPRQCTTVNSMGAQPGSITQSKMKYYSRINAATVGFLPTTDLRAVANRLLTQDTPS